MQGTSTTGDHLLLTRALEADLPDLSSFRHLLDQYNETDHSTSDLTEAGTAGEQWAISLEQLS